MKRPYSPTPPITIAKLQAHKGLLLLLVQTLLAASLLTGCFLLPDDDESFLAPPPRPAADTCNGPLDRVVVNAAIEPTEGLEGVLFGPPVSQPTFIPSDLCVTITVPNCGGVWQLNQLNITTTDGSVVRYGANGEWGQNLGRTQKACVEAPPAETVVAVTIDLERTTRDGVVVQHPASLTKTKPGLDTLTIVADSLGGVWMGTLRNGVIGVNGAEITHFPGVPLSEDFDWNYQGPQAPVVPTLLLDEANDGLWVGSFITGISRLDTAVGFWRHFDLDPGDFLADAPVGPFELAQTPLGLLSDGRDGLWVGTANGVYYMEVGPATPTHFHRAAAGVVTSMGRRLVGDGRPQEIWVGHTLDGEPDTHEEFLFWPKPETSLTVLFPDEGKRWRVGEVALQVPGSAVLTLLVTAESAFVGTDEGLFRALLTPGQPVDATTTFEWVDLPNDTGATVVTALTSDGKGGAWIGLTHECIPDEGALVHLAADGSTTTYRQSTDSDVTTIAVLPDGTLVVGTTTISSVMGRALSPCMDTGDLFGDVYLVDPQAPLDADWEPLR